MNTMYDLNILALLGATGSGKTYFSNELCKLHSPTLPTFYKPKQVTTRKSRNTREDKANYNFITKEEYNSLIEEDKLTAKTHFNDNDYGTLINEFSFDNNTINIVVVSKEGFEDLVKFSNMTEYEVNLKSCLILSDLNENIIASHKRDKDFVTKEMMGLLSRPYDIYLPNYSLKRASVEDILNCLN